MPAIQQLPMPRSRAIVSLAGLACALAGCATQDVVFVTKTAIGIDVDAQGASVAYDRTEGYVAPRYPNRQALPVLASVATDGKLLDRKVKQVYATGNAARIVSEPAPVQAAQPARFRNTALDAAAAAAPTDPALAASPPKSMFFGTGSVLGFKVSFGPAAAVDTFTLGFKRKEMSLIPHDAADRDLPSVLASLDAGAEAAAATGSKLMAKQFFATGAAADSLAGNDQIRRQFQDEAKTRLAQYQEDERSQRGDALVSLGCLSELNDEQVAKVWQNVQDLSLFEKEAIDDLMAAPTSSAARTIYTKEIGRTAADSSVITNMMKAHKFFVCRLVNRV